MKYLNDYFKKNLQGVKEFPKWEKDVMIFQLQISL